MLIIFNAILTIDKGLRFLDHSRLKKIIYDLYKYKSTARGKIIYITATALCHLAKQYGIYFLELPFSIGDFGTTNIIQIGRKAAVTLLLGVVAPLCYSGTYIRLLGALILGLVGLKLFSLDLYLIPTSPIDKIDSVNN